MIAVYHSINLERCKITDAKRYVNLGICNMKHVIHMVQLISITFSVVFLITLLKTCIF